MKLLHTSDWHFGKPIGNTAGDTYEACQRHFLDQLYHIIETEHVDAVLCAGDVYDSSVSNADAIRLYDETATRICLEHHTPLLVIAGNHDGAARLAACSELLKAAGLYVAGRLTRDPAPILLGEGKVAVYLLPFFHKEEVIALFPEHKEEITSQERAVQVVCDHIRATMDPTRRNILVAHSTIINAELSESDRSAQIGRATAVSKSVFDGFDYVALGHIHKPQIMDTHIRYSGSPVKYSFGSEENQQKGVVLLDTDTMEQTFLPVTQLHERLTVEDTLEHIMAREDLTDHYLRLRLTDTTVSLELMSLLQSRFPRMLEVLGANQTMEQELTALTVEELNTLEDTDIMLKFLEETYPDYAPTDRQLSLFREALEAMEQEGDLE